MYVYCLYTCRYTDVFDGSPSFLADGHVVQHALKIVQALLTPQLMLRKRVFNKCPGEKHGGVGEVQMKEPSARSA